MKSPRGTVHYVTQDEGECVATEARFSIDEGALTIYDCANGEAPIEYYPRGRFFDVYMVDQEKSAPETD